MKTVEINDIDKMEEYISQSNFCYLALVDSEGVPYSLPMNFGYENQTIYLHSAPEGSAFDYITAGKPVSITFCTNADLVFQSEKIACSYRMRAASIIARGEVEIVEDMEEKRHALDTMMQHFTKKSFEYRDPAVRNVFVFKLKASQMTCKAFGIPYRESLKM